MTTTYEEPKDYVGLTQCYFCNKSSGILLHTRMSKVLPRQAIYNMEPCHECQDFMKQGIILISVTDESIAEMDQQYRDWQHASPPDGYNWNSRIREAWDRRQFMPNPYRTGGWWVISEDAVRRIFDDQTADKLCRMRWSFIPEEVCTQLGLKKGALDA